VDEEEKPAKKEEKKTEKKEEKKEKAKKYNEGAKPIAGCCQPSVDGTVQKCQKEKAMGIPYCAVDSIVNPTKEEKKKKEE